MMAPARIRVAGAGPAGLALAARGRCAACDRGAARAIA
jgi:flavin-dependent dehydrogenase